MMRLGTQGGEPFGLARLCSVDPETSALIRGRLEAHDFSDAACLRILQQGFRCLPRVKRSMMKQGPGQAVLLGLYSLGGFRGVSRAAGENPEVVKYLNGYLKNQCCVRVEGHPNADSP